MDGTAAVTIVGSGPYGLSLAAHLSGGGLEPRIFGPPMHHWRDGMPRGMLLKSEGFASCLSDPDGAFTLRAFCAAKGLPYADIGVPPPIETFVAYGLAFQQRFAPQLDTRMVRHIERAPHGFTLYLEDHSCVRSQRVVITTGIEHFAHVPKALRGLPRHLVTHSRDHADYTCFAQRRVIVIGAGASALDAVAALCRSGAEPILVSRNEAIRFYGDPKPRGPLDWFLAPMTPLGPGWRKLLCVKAPQVFHLLPESLRVGIVRHSLGPAPAWFVRETVEGCAPYVLSSKVTGGRPTKDGVALELEVADGTRQEIEADHVIAATGFRVDVDRLTFLDPSMRRDLDRVQRAPKLSSSFESSVRGLYFIGPAAAYEFGPLLRFVCGADYAARRVSRHLLSARRSLDKKTPTPQESFRDPTSIYLSPATRDPLCRDEDDIRSPGV